MSHKDNNKLFNFHMHHSVFKTSHWSRKTAKSTLNSDTSLRTEGTPKSIIDVIATLHIILFFYYYISFLHWHIELYLSISVFIEFSNILSYWFFQSLKCKETLILEIGEFSKTCLRLIRKYCENKLLFRWMSSWLLSWCPIK